MTGGGAGLRALARELRVRAGEIRDDAVLIGAAAARTTGPDGWTGRAAEAMRTSVTEGCARLERTATAHDEAAEALEAHAVAVEESWLPDDLDAWWPW